MPWPGTEPAWEWGMMDERAARIPEKPRGPLPARQTPSDIEKMTIDSKSQVSIRRPAPGFVRLWRAARPFRVASRARQQRRMNTS